MKEDRHKLKIVAASCSLGTAIALVAVKYWAFTLTGSAAILSDALETVINVAAGGFALMSVIYAAQPPDRQHPYGHGKIEFFSAGFEGLLIMAASALIMVEAVDKVLNPEALPNLGAGTLLVAGAALANVLLGLFLLRTGKRTNSLTLVADGKHVLTDVYTSGGVVVGLIAVKFTGLAWLDGAVAGVVGLHILFTGFGLLRESVRGLMDVQDPGTVQEICDVIKDLGNPALIGIHRLRASRYGGRLVINFHAALDRNMSFLEAHDLVKRMEDALIAHFPDEVDVVIHADPCKGLDCAKCGHAECMGRTTPPDCGLPSGLTPEAATSDRCGPEPPEEGPGKP